MKKIVLLLLLTITFSGCEKDDVCTDETTPRLILEFYDISNPSNFKNVLNLKVTVKDKLNLALITELIKLNYPWILQMI